MDEREDKSTEEHFKNEREEAPSTDRDRDEVRTIIEEISIEEVGIDGMCGVY